MKLSRKFADKLRAAPPVSDMVDMPPYDAPPYDAPPYDAPPPSPYDAPPPPPYYDAPPLPMGAPVEAQTGGAIPVATPVATAVPAGIPAYEPATPPKAWQRMQNMGSQFKTCILHNSKFWTILYLLYTMHLVFFLVKKDPENMEVFYWIVFGICILSAIAFVVTWNRKTN